MPTSSPLGIDQRAAGIARIDRRVGLDEILQIGQADIGPSHGAHDPHGDRLVQTEGIADRKDNVACPHLA